jgi:hypothetical protein
LIFQKTAIHFRLNAKYFAANPEAIRRNGFFPEKDPSLLHNCKQYFWVEPDGKVLHAAYLNALEESFREEIILRHYVSHMVKVIGNGPIGFNILSRDKPWDFRLELSSGSTINVEISSFTDRANFFKKITAEEMIQRHSYYKTVRLGLLKKIAKSFPDAALNVAFKGYEAEGLSNSDEVPNPYFPELPRFFTSLQDLSALDLLSEVNNAIAKKQQKNHDGKRETVLVLDNRTAIAGLNDFERIAVEIASVASRSEFSEIWLYTGYGGGHDQEYEDYCLLPIKLSDELANEYLAKRFQISS